MTLSCVHLDDLLVVFSLLSVASTWGWGKNRNVNTWIHVRLCGNRVSKEKKCTVVLWAWWWSRSTREKSEVESQDECVLELAPAPGTIIPSLRTSHPFIHFHLVLYRTLNRLFLSIWYQVTGPWERRKDHTPPFLHLWKTKKRIDLDSTRFYEHCQSF